MSDTAPAIDILGMGCVAVDDLLYVSEYPPADGKVRVSRRERHCGGLTATALVAASRLGARCSYATTLGDDELSRFVLDRFGAEQVDVRWVRQRAGAHPIHSIIIVDEQRHTRAIFYDREGFPGADPEWPAEAVLRSARVLFVDHVGVPGMVRAARIARAAGIPVVADLEDDGDAGFAELLALVDHLIVSQSFASQLTGERGPAAARALWRTDRQAVVVTDGERGCWYVGAEEPGWPQHQPAFPVEVVDTNGCGDVFHGAYAAGLVQGMDLGSRIRLAAATAALKATQRGGQAGIPTRPAVEAFLSSHGSLGTSERDE